MIRLLVDASPKIST